MPTSKRNQHLRKRILLVCSGCSKPFEIQPYLKRKTNYCSKECYWNSTRIEEKRMCKICGKEFTATGAQIRKGFGVYCGRQCQRAAYPKRIIKYCLQCHKELTVPPSKKDLVKFCSKKCKDDFERDYLTFKCKQCRKTFEIPRSDFNRGRGKFCSWECSIKYKGPSSLEEKMMKVLGRAKIKYQREIKFKRFYVDFLIEEKKLAIECDGEFWHMRPKIKERDRRKEKFLNSLGYKVLRFSGTEINKLSENQIMRQIGEV